MTWFKKKKKPEQSIILPRQGFFSTDIDFSGLNPLARAQKVEEKLALSFQRSLADFKPVDNNGTVVSGVAMDSACTIPTSNSIIGSAYQGVPDAQLSWYGSQGFIGYQLAALLSQNWLIDKACSMPAKDACRHGYEITVNDGTEIKPEILEYMRKQDKKFSVNKNCVEFVRNGRIFGIRIALFIVKSPDPYYYEKPFNPDGVLPGSYMGISQVDPYWVSPELSLDAASNPAAIDFYEPTWWRINGKRYHRSHLVIMRNGEVPDILKPTYLYGGIPVPQKIGERVFAGEQTANEGPKLAMSKRLTVLNVDITQAMANKEKFDEKMTLWANYMNNFGVKVVGETETIEQFDTSLNDLDMVIMTQYQLVAAGSGVPATKLLGTSPKGFNATGEFEQKSYHEELETIQEHDLSPLVERHHLLLIRSHVLPKFPGTLLFSTEVNWKPVDSPTAEQQADLNLKKAQTDQALVGIGSLDGADVRDRLIADKDSGYNGIAPIEDTLLPEIVVGDEDGEESAKGVNSDDNS